MLLDAQLIDTPGIGADTFDDAGRLGGRGPRPQMIDERGRLVLENVHAQVTAVVTTRRARDTGTGFGLLRERVVDDAVQLPAQLGFGCRLAAFTEDHRRSLKRRRSRCVQTLA
jgi:hypothetical protein